MDENALAIINFEDYAMSTQTVVKQVNIIQDVMKNVMQDGEHYGVIPGTNKPSLLKPGAEKLGFTFRLRPEYEIITRDLGNAHREYEIVCTLYHTPTGVRVGQGVGSCSTMESKYRYRGGLKISTGKPVPKEYWNLDKAGKTAEARDLIGGQGFGVGKFEGKWEICEIGERVEHDNPADYYNTCLKMAKKRAHVDAILTATAASDIFTQDTEDLAANGVIKPTKQETKKADAKQAKGKEGKDQKITSSISGVTFKDGKKDDGTDYTLFTILDEQGEKYTTFDKKIAEKAKSAKEGGVMVNIIFEKSQYGNRISSLEAASADV